MSCIIVVINLLGYTKNLVSARVAVINAGNDLFFVVVYVFKFTKFFHRALCA